MSDVEDENKSLDNEIKRMIADCLNISFKDVVLDAKFIEDFGADDMDLVELIIIIEKEFNISIDDNDVLTFITVRDFIIYIKKHVFK